MRELVREAALVRELVAPRRLLGLVEEDDAEAAVEVRLGLEALADLRGVERELRRRSPGRAGSGSSCPLPRTFSAPEIFCHLRGRLAARVRLLAIRAPSRLTVAVISDESAQTTDEPTPWRPPEWT